MRVPDVSRLLVAPFPGRLTLVCILCRYSIRVSGLSSFYQFRFLVDVADDFTIRVINSFAEKMHVHPSTSVYPKGCVLVAPGNHHWLIFSALNYIPFVNLLPVLVSKSGELHQDIIMPPDNFCVLCVTALVRGCPVVAVEINPVIKIRHHSFQNGVPNPESYFSVHFKCSLSLILECQLVDPCCRSKSENRF